MIDGDQTDERTILSKSPDTVNRGLALPDTIGNSALKI